jgi:hypothetical protein
MHGTSRHDTRRLFFDGCAKRRRGERLQGVEVLVAEVIEHHPEYHGLLQDAEAGLTRDWSPEDGEGNPFLHMGMHIAIREQVSIDRPQGVAEAHQRLSRRLGSMLEAEHQMMECLGRELWESQRAGRMPDEHAYLACVRERAGL